MERPNFFIVGAPKCGTTALSHYLKEHPLIFFSTPKELSFFGQDYRPTFKPIQNLKHYLSFFKSASPKHLAIGEGSPRYLFSKDAAKEILHFNPKSKFIVMLRNPIDMFFSLYTQHLFHRKENAKTPQKAWALQEIRQKNYKILPLRCRNPKDLHYSEQCKLGYLVERLLKTTSRHKIHFILYDDFQKDTQRVYQSVLKFLNVPDDNRTSFPVLNSSKVLIHKNLNLCFKALYGVLQLRHKIRLGWIGSSKIEKIIQTIQAKLCYQNLPKQRLDDDFIQELKKHFKEDILKLSKILNRDLSHWVE